MADRAFCGRLCPYDHLSADRAFIDMHLRKVICAGVEQDAALAGGCFGRSGRRKILILLISAGIFPE